VRCTVDLAAADDICQRDQDSWDEERFRWVVEGAFQSSTVGGETVCYGCDGEEEDDQVEDEEDLADGFEAGEFVWCCC
jgi:hypothetical protein